MNELERFWTKVDKSGDCWVWTAARNELGYGNFCNAERRTELAHRASWRLTYGPVPDEMNVLHRCDNPPCVRPDHLFLGTDADNVADMIAKGRQHRVDGERNGRAKLTDAQVAEIRAQYVPGKVRIVDLAEEYGVTFSHIWQIVAGLKRREHNDLPWRAREFPLVP